MQNTNISSKKLQYINAMLDFKGTGYSFYPAGCFSAGIAILSAHSFNLLANDSTVMYFLQKLLVYQMSSSEQDIIAFFAN